MTGRSKKGEKKQKRKRKVINKKIKNKKIKKKERESCGCFSEHSRVSSFSN